MNQDEIRAVIEVLSECEEPIEHDQSLLDHEDTEFEMKTENAVGSIKRGRYDCRICGEVFTRKLDMHIHRLNHTSKKEVGSAEEEESHSQVNQQPKDYSNDVELESLLHDNQTHHQVISTQEDMAEKQTDFPSVSAIKGEQSERTVRIPNQLDPSSSIITTKSAIIPKTSPIKNTSAQDLEQCMKIAIQNSLSSVGIDSKTLLANTFVPDQDEAMKIAIQSSLTSAGMLPHLASTVSPSYHITRIYKCPQCPVSFSDILAYRQHVSTHPEKAFKCQTCGKLFTIKGNLQRHEQVHLDIRPFKCETCGKTFSQKTHLEAHVNVHSKDRTYYVCGTCGTCFTRQGNLKRHERIHSKQKPFQCHLCGRCFTQPGNLKVHVATHAEERPFECSECGKTFTRKGNLTRHLELHRERAARAQFREIPLPPNPNLNSRASCNADSDGQGAIEVCVDN